MGLWRKSTSTILVPLVTAKPKPLAPNGSWWVRVTLTAERGNTSMVCVGDSNLMCVLGGTPNYALVQLDPGRVGHIWVDDIDNEEFDLGDYFVQSDVAAGSIFLYVTTWAFQR